MEKLQQTEIVGIKLDNNTIYRIDFGNVNPPDIVFCDKITYLKEGDYFVVTGSGFKSNGYKAAPDDCDIFIPVEKVTETYIRKVTKNNN